MIIYSHDERCHGTTKAGTRCNNNASIVTDEGNFCKVHAPERAPKDVSGKRWLVLGFDPSSTALGMFASVTDRNGQVVSERRYCSRPSKQNDASARLVVMDRDLYAWLSEIDRTSPEYDVAFAGVERAVNVKGTRSRGLQERVYAMILLALIHRGVPFEHVVQIYPGTAKKHVFGSGAFGKGARTQGELDKYMATVYEITGRDFHDNDIVDAYAICKCVLDALRDECGPKIRLIRARFGLSV